MNTNLYVKTSGAEGYKEISADDLRRIIALLDMEKRPGSSSREAKRINLNSYIRTFIDDIASGKRITNRGTRFSKGTVQSFQQTIRKWDQFQSARRAMLDFEEVDMSVYREYTAFLMEQRYSINSIGKCIKNLKQILLAAEEDGHQIHHTVRGRGFKVFQVKTDAIYLSKDELDAIKNVNLVGMPDCYSRARDLFLIGVWTAQRVSDYNHLQRENIREETLQSIDHYGNTTRRCVRTITLTQHKTGKRVTIPCSQELCSILDRYPAQLPHLYEQRFNSLIKEIGRMAGLDQIVEISSTKGGVPTKIRAHKWELIHTHTARRTGATLMYLSGMDVYDICKITGHSSVSMLERYIKADELETVRKITEEYDYFK